MCHVPPRVIIIVITHTIKNPIGRTILIGKLSPKNPLINNPIEYENKKAKSTIPELLLSFHPKSSSTSDLRIDHPSLVKCNQE